MTNGLIYGSCMIRKHTNLEGEAYYTVSSSEDEADLDFIVNDCYWSPINSAEWIERSALLLLLPKMEELPAELKAHEITPKEIAMYHDTGTEFVKVYEVKEK